jgi:hypothetical protein
MMSAKHVFEEKGKIKNKPEREKNEPQKDHGSQEASGRLDHSQLKQLQQTVGNTAVQRLLAQRSGSGPTDLEEETGSAINQERGSGQQLDSGIAAKAGQTMGQDFSDVTVHTDSKADELSNQLGAKAFTTGKDIFFRQGEYDPAGSSGQHLISHELTHVAQQGASAPSVQGKMSVNDPNDQYESEADKVADTVMAQPEDMVQQQEDEEVQMQEDEEVQMQEDEEVQMQEDEEVQMQEDEEVQMQEDEEVQMKEGVQRQEEEEVEA